METANPHPQYRSPTSLKVSHHYGSRS